LLLAFPCNIIQPRNEGESIVNLKTIRDMGDLEGKKVLVRADLNVPAKDGIISDASRIGRFAPTAELLAGKGARVVIITHFGRPEGKDMKFSCAFLAPALSKYVGKSVEFAPDALLGATAASGLKDGEIALLENVRFYPEEEANDPAFAEKLAEGFDFFVNDAFSAAHRAHASTEGITKYLPSFAGLLMEEEIAALSKALEHPARPSVAIVAGAKISTKLELLANLAKKVDTILIGGAMANTFLFAVGENIGDSLAERDMAGTAKKILEAAKGKIVLPMDAVVAVSLEAPSRTARFSDIAPDEKILDIGSESVKLFKEKIAASKTLLMNGPVGLFEVKPFDKATTDLARFIISRVKAGELAAVAGGGDTVSALEQSGAASGFTYISTAGGAFLEWLEGKTLPAIPPLEK